MVMGTTMATAAVLLVICVSAIVRPEKTTIATNPPPPASGMSLSASHCAVPVSLRICPSADPPANR